MRSKDASNKSNIHIEDYLQKGFTNRKTSRQLEAETGLGKRAIQAAARDARMRGHLVAGEFSNRGGLFLCGNEEEVRRYYRKMIGMNIRAFEPLKPFAEFLKTDPNQMTLEELSNYAEVEGDDQTEVEEGNHEDIA